MYLAEIVKVYRSYGVASVAARVVVDSECNAQRGLRANATLKARPRCVAMVVELFIGKPSSEAAREAALAIPGVRVDTGRNQQKSIARHGWRLRNGRLAPHTGMLPEGASWLRSVV